MVFQSLPESMWLYSDFFSCSVPLGLEGHTHLNSGVCSWPLHNEISLESTEQLHNITCCCTDGHYLKSKGTTGRNKADQKTRWLLTKVYNKIKTKWEIKVSVCGFSVFSHFLLVVCSFISLTHPERVSAVICQLSLHLCSFLFSLSTSIFASHSPLFVFFSSLFLWQLFPRLLKPPHSSLLNSLCLLNILCQEPAEVNSIHPALLFRCSPLQCTSSPNFSLSASICVNKWITPYF